MAAPPILKTRQAVVRFLKANADLAATAIGAKIYGERPPAKDLLWPFVRCDSFDALPRWEIGGLIHVFSKGPYSDEASMITEIIGDAIDDAVLDLGDGRKAYIALERIRIIPDGAEQDAWHGICQIRAFAPKDCPSSVSTGATILDSQNSAFIVPLIALDADDQETPFSKIIIDSEGTEFSIQGN